MRILLQLFTLMRLWIQLIFKMLGICDHWSIDPPGLYFEPSGFHCELYFELYFEPINFDFNADPHPTVHSNVHPDPDPASKNNADPDPGT
jgi:hypothetical protein